MWGRRHRRPREGEGEGVVKRCKSLGCSFSRIAVHVRMYMCCTFKLNIVEFFIIANVYIYIRMQPRARGGVTKHVHIKIRTSTGGSKSLHDFLDLPAER